MSSEKLEYFKIEDEDGGYLDYIKKEKPPKQKATKKCSCADFTVIINYIQAE